MNLNRRGTSNAPYPKPRRPRARMLGVDEQVLEEPTRSTLLGFGNQMTGRSSVVTEYHGHSHKKKTPKMKSRLRNISPFDPSSRQRRFRRPQGNCSSFKLLCKFIFQLLLITISGLSIYSSYFLNLKLKNLNADIETLNSTSDNN